MNKLLRSNFSRLWKNKFFWLCMAAMLVYAILYMLNACRHAAANMSKFQYDIDRYYFDYALSVGFFCSLFGSMFFGTEFSDGVIRNKIIGGHTRANIYMASLITTFAATLMNMSVWLVSALVAVPVLGFWKMGVLRLLLLLLISVMFALAYYAIFTVVNMLSSNKALTVLISFLLFLGLLVFASLIYNSLCEPEIVGKALITANGLEIISEPSPNPNYITGVRREIYDFIVDFLPMGQVLRMRMMDITDPIRMLVSSLFITVTATAGGLFAFKKKNIK